MAIYFDGPDSPDDRDEIDDRREYPAARCRGCGVTTWVCSIVEGRRPVRARHRRGCEAPPGRIDLIERIGDRKLERELFGEKLRRCMGNYDCAVAAEKLEAL